MTDTMYLKHNAHWWTLFNDLHNALCQKVYRPTCMTNFVQVPWKRCITHFNIWQFLCWCG